MKRPHITFPRVRGFQFVAAQLGASEYQIAQIIPVAPRAIKEENETIGTLLAFPYHDRRGGAGLTQQQVDDLWAAWESVNSNLSSAKMDLQDFRKLIDPWLQHKGSWPSASNLPQPYQRPGEHGDV